MVTKTYAKGDVLQLPGTVKLKSFYVKKGVLRSFIIDSKGKEHIFMFAPEDWIIADVESLEYGRPAELYIDCTEDAEVAVFDHDILSDPRFSKEMVLEYNHLLYRRMGVLQRRVLMLMSATAADRYAFFMEAYPELPNRVPQRMIATYLGITPQALSTIKSKMVGSKQ